MAFTKKTWKDRLVEYAGRRKITNVSTLAAQVVDVERAEGIVSEEGSAFNAANMNDLEQRVSDGFTSVQNSVNGVISDLVSFQSSFRAGLSTIAAAITSMGVATPSNASPATMAANIRALSNYASGSFVASYDAKTFNCGFRPSKVVVFNTNPGRADLMIYDARISTSNVYAAYHNAGVRFGSFSGQGPDVNYSNLKFSVSDSGFAFGNIVAYAGSDTMYWFACK